MILMSKESLAAALRQQQLALSAIPPPSTGGKTSKDGTDRHGFLHPLKYLAEKVGGTSSIPADLGFAEPHDSELSPKMVDSFLLTWCSTWLASGAADEGLGAEQHA